MSRAKTGWTPLVTLTLYAAAAGHAGEAEAEAESSSSPLKALGNGWRPSAGSGGATPARSDGEQEKENRPPPPAQPPRRLRARKAAGAPSRTSSLGASSRSSSLGGSACSAPSASFASATSEAAAPPPAAATSMEHALWQRVFGAESASAASPAAYPALAGALLAGRVFLLSGADTQARAVAKLLDTHDAAVRRTENGYSVARAVRGGRTAFRVPRSLERALRDAVHPAVAPLGSRDMLGERTVQWPGSRSLLAHSDATGAHP